MGARDACLWAYPATCLGTGTRFRTEASGAMWMAVVLPGCPVGVSQPGAGDAVGEVDAAAARAVDEAVSDQSRTVGAHV